MTWRSTKLGKIDRHCLAVLCFEESEDRRIYEAGKVAHYIMEQAQIATNRAEAPLSLMELEHVCEAAMAATAEHGFTWEGQAEPPPRPDAAKRGRWLAERWLEDNPPEPGFQAEAAFTINRWCHLVEKDSPDAWARGIIDRIGLQEIVTDEEEYMALVIGDTKSDWQSGRKTDDEGLEVSLNNVQRRLQALGGWAMFQDEDFSAIILEIYSLPRMWTYRRRLLYDEMGMLDEWRRELLALTDGYDRRIARYGLDPEKLASPGVGCKGCPHFGECAPGRRHLEKRRATDPPEDLAAAYAAHDAELSRLRDYLQPICDETGAVVSGDTEVGYEERDQTVVAPNAAEVVWQTWKRQHLADEAVEGGPEEQISLEDDAFARDLLQGYLDGIRLGKTSLMKLLRTLWPTNRGPKPERDEKKRIRSEILAKVTKTRKTPVFGVRRIAPPEPTLEEQLKAALEAPAPEPTSRADGDQWLGPLDHSDYVFLRGLSEAARSSIRAWRQGASLAEISDLYGLSETTILAYLSNARVSLGPSKVPKKARGRPVASKRIKPGSTESGGDR